MLGGCLCFDLPTGCKIIGTIYLICSIINTLSLLILNVMVWVLGMGKMIADGFEKVRESGTHVNIGGVNINVDDDYSSGAISGGGENVNLNLPGTIGEITGDKAQDAIFTVQVVCLCLLILVFMSLITSSMLISGTRNRRRGLLLPWIIQEVIHIIVGIFFVGIFFYFLGNQKAAWYLAGPFFVTVTCQFYFIFVVISQFQALRMLMVQDDNMMLK